MSWLSDFAYRMPFEVANPTTTGDRAIDAVPFPAWFLKAQGHIVESTYADVHVTKADGTTELPCELNAAKNALYIDYASMPAGRTTLYVYYGKSGAEAPSACSFWTPARGAAGITDPESGGTLLPLEGTDGDDITGWTLTNTPTFQYKTAHKFAGTTGAYLTKTGATGVADYATSSINSDGAEYRCWVWVPSDTESCAIAGNFSGTATDDIVWYARFGSSTNSGKIDVYTRRSGVTGYTQNAYTPVGSFSPKTLFQVRVVLDFSNDTYTLSTRTEPGGEWTQHKASGASDYNIPFYGANNITSCPGFRALVPSGKTLYFDEVRYSDSGMTDAQVPSTLVQVIQPREEYGASDTAPTVYVWGSDVDATYLSSHASGTHFGNQNEMKCGYEYWYDKEVQDYADDKYHALVRFFDGALPKGTIDDARLYLYVGTTCGSASEFRAYPFSHYGDSTSSIWSAVKTGWMRQTQGYPTWTHRMYDQQAKTVRAWETPGGTGTNEIDYDLASSLSLSPSESGWRYFSIDAAKATAWLGDTYSQGLLIKGQTESGTEDCFFTFPAPSEHDCPVFVFKYSGLSESQMSGRKLASDTYHSAVFPLQSKFSSSEMTHGFMAMIYTSNDLGIPVVLVSPNGRMRRLSASVLPSQAFVSNNAGLWGLNFDESTGRYWIAMHDQNAEIRIGRSEPYDPGTWTWFTHDGSLKTAKSSIAVHDDTAYVFALDIYTSSLYFLTCSSTGTFSSPVEVVKHVVSPERSLAVAIASDDVMDGDGTIVTDGSVSAYYSFGFVKIDDEYFWYTGKSGNSLTGVRRAMLGTSPASHAVSSLVDYKESWPTYTDVAYDEVRNAVHVTCGLGHEKPPGGWDEWGMLYLRHYLEDDPDDWCDADDNHLTTPIYPADTPMVSRPSSPAYPGCVLVNEYGDVHVTVQEYSGIGGVISTITPQVATLLYGGSGWTYQAKGGYASTLTDFGEGRMTLVSRSTTSPTTAYVMWLTLDNGQTWGQETVIDSHSFPYSALANPGVSARANVAGKALSYANHYTQFGAIYLTALDLIPREPTDVTLEVIDGDARLAWTDNCTFETAYAVRRSTDGGESWMVLTEELDPDTESYIDETLGAYTALVYEVYALYGSIAGVAGASNVLTAGGVPVWLLRHHSNLDWLGGN